MPIHNKCDMSYGKNTDNMNNYNVDMGMPIDNTSNHDSNNNFIQNEQQINNLNPMGGGILTDT